MSTVTTVIRLEGQDRASAAIRSAAGSTQDLAQRVKGAAEQSGNAEKALLGIRDIAGALPGPLGAAADLFGGIEKLFVALPGPIGIATAAVALLGAGILKMHEDAKEAARKLAETEKERLDQLKTEPGILADVLGVSRQLLGATNDRKSAEEQAGQVADQWLKLQKDRLDAIAEGDKGRVRVLDQQLGSKRRMLQLLDAELLASSALAADVERSRKYEETRAQIREQRDANTLSMMSERERLDLRGNRLVEQRAEIERTIANVKNNFIGLSRADVQQRVAELRLQQEKIDAEAILLAAEGSRFAQAEKARRGAGGNRARAAAEEAQRISNIEQRELNKLGLAQALAAEEEVRLAEETAARIAQFELEQSIRQADLDAAEFDREVDESDRRREQAKAEAMAKQDMALGVAKATVAGLEQMGLAEQAAAGLKAVIAGAEAALAFTRGRYDQAVAGAFAAAQFASVAIGGGGGERPPVGGSGAGPSATTTLSSQGQAAPQQVNVFYGMLGTPQQNGLQATKILKSLKGTGYKAA